jgi:hypothetical protein
MLIWILDFFSSYFRLLLALILVLFFSCFLFGPSGSCLVLLGHVWCFWVLLCPVLLGPVGSSWVVFGPVGFCWVLWGHGWFFWVQLGPVASCWVLSWVHLGSLDMRLFIFFKLSLDKLSRFKYTNIIFNFTS